MTKPLALAIFLCGLTVFAPSAKSSTSGDQVMPPAVRICGTARKLMQGSHPTDGMVQLGLGDGAAWVLLRATAEESRAALGALQPNNPAFRCAFGDVLPRSGGAYKPFFDVYAVVAPPAYGPVVIVDPVDEVPAPPMPARYAAVQLCGELEKLSGGVSTDGMVSLRFGANATFLRTADALLQQTLDALEPGQVQIACASGTKLPIATIPHGLFFDADEGIEFGPSPSGISVSN